MTVKQYEQQVGNRRSQELKWLSKDSTVEKSKVATIAFRHFKMLGPMFFVDQALFVMNCSYEIDIMPAGSFMAAMRTRAGHRTRLVRNWFHPVPGRKGWSVYKVAADLCAAQKIWMSRVVSML